MNDTSIAARNAEAAMEDFRNMVNPDYVSAIATICRAMSIAVKNDAGITLNREELLVVGRAVFVAAALAHKALLEGME